MLSVKSPWFRVLFPLLALFLLLRLVFWLTTFPNPDEAYYWLWGQHPALSYYDHPPFQAWVQGGVTAVLGQSFLSLRWANLVSNAILAVTYYRIAHYLYGREGVQSFWWAIALVVASPLYFLFLALAWPDHWLMTFSLLAAEQFIRFLDGYEADGQGESRRLYGAALALGLALLCKYNAVFVGLGFLGAVVTNRQWRRLLRDRRFYLAALITLSCLLPIVLWNVGNDFQSFRYYVNRSVDDGGLRLKVGQLATFVLVSGLMVGPVQVWAMVRAIRRPSPLQSSAYRSVALWIFAVSTLMLMTVSLVSTALYYWNITAYLLLFPLLPTAFMRRSQDEPLTPATAVAGAIARPGLFLGGQAYGLLFASLLVVHYSIVPLSVFGSLESDPDSRMLFGWDAVATVVQQQAQTLGPDALVLATDYRSASALAYQLNNPQVLAISDRIDQFDFWYDPAQVKGKDAVIVADDWHPFPLEFGRQFRQLSAPVVVPVRRFGWLVKYYYVMTGSHYQPQVQGQGAIAAPARALPAASALKQSEPAR